MSTFPPSSVLSLLNLQKVTGILYLQNRSLAATISIENGGLMKRKATMSSKTAMNQPQKTMTPTRTARRKRSR